MKSLFTPRQNCKIIYWNQLPEFSKDCARRWSASCNFAQRIAPPQMKASMMVRLPACLALQPRLAYNTSQ